LKEKTHQAFIWNVKTTHPKQINQEIISRTFSVSLERLYYFLSIYAYCKEYTSFHLGQPEAKLPSVMYTQAIAHA